MPPTRWLHVVQCLHILGGPEISIELSENTVSKNRLMNFIMFPIQWKFQDPKLEVRTIYKAYVREYTGNIWPYMVQYLHFRFLK